jgi:hypothetical protein
LLKEMEKYTWESHPDFENIKLVSSFILLFLHMICCVELSIICDQQLFLFR